MNDKYTVSEAYKDLTIYWIIDTLKKDGANSKKKVVQALENATINELIQLKLSIEGLIEMSGGSND